MPNYTPNLNLTKPFQNEFYDVNIFNDNADKIDTAFNNINNNSYQKPSGGIPLSDVSSQITDRLDWYGVATGNLSLSLNIPEFTGELKSGLTLKIKIVNGGSGTFSLNFNNKGSKSIKRPNGSNVNKMETGGVYTLVYDGTNFILQGEGSGGNALASEILQNRSATTDNGEVIGTMPNRGPFNLGLGVPVPAGYYGAGVTADGRKSETRNVAVSYDGTGLLVNVTGIAFEPKILILTLIIGNVLYRKVYNGNGYSDTFTVASNDTLLVTGGWNIGLSNFNTRILNVSHSVGTNCECIIIG